MLYFLHHAYVILPRSKYAHESGFKAIKKGLNFLQQL